MNRHLRSPTTVVLGEVAALNPHAPRLSPTEEVAFVPMASVSEQGSMIAETASVADLKAGFSYFQRGDVLVAKITPCYENNKITVANFSQLHGFGSTEFHVLRPVVGVLDSSYLTYFLRQDRIRQAGEQRMTGSGGQRRVPRQFLQNLLIPLPCIDEQRRIAAILDQADNLRQKRRAALEQLELLATITFFDMFGDMLSNNKGWPSASTLGELAVIVSGVTKGRKTNGAAVRQVPYLAVANVQDRALHIKSVKSIEATEVEIARYRLMPGDLLLTEGGDPDKLGRGTLWQGELPECIHQNHIFRVRLSSEFIEPIYLNWLVASERGRRYFLQSAKQTTGIASINMGQLRNFPILLPPIDLQRAFAARVAEIDKLKAAHRAHLAQLDALFASLQHRAFRGEL